MKRITSTLTLSFCIALAACDAPTSPVASLESSDAVAFAKGGNSSFAAICHQNGWMDLRRADGSSFKNTGDCVKYGAQGGTFTAGPPPEITSISVNPRCDLGNMYEVAVTFTGGTGTINTGAGDVAYTSGQSVIVAPETVVVVTVTAPSGTSTNAVILVPPPGCT